MYHCTLFLRASRKISFKVSLLTDLLTFFRPSRYLCKRWSCSEVESVTSNFKLQPADHTENVTTLERFFFFFFFFFHIICISFMLWKETSSVFYVKNFRLVI